MGEFNGEIRMLAELKEKLFSIVEKYNELAIMSKCELYEQCTEKLGKISELANTFLLAKDEHVKWIISVKDELEAIRITGKGDLVYHSVTYTHRNEIIYYVKEHLQKLYAILSANCCGMLNSSCEYEAYKNFLTNEYMVYTNK